MAETPGSEEQHLAFKTVVIHKVGSQKIGFIKLLRQWTGLGLKEAKDVSELPAPFALVVCEEARANDFRRLVEDVGVVCEVRDFMDTDQPVVSNDARFDFQGTAKSGCAGSACLLLAFVGVGVVGLSLIL